MDFKNRNALITGGSSGIGYSIAEKLLIQGINSVVIVGKNPVKLNEAKSSLEKRFAGKVFALNVDLEDSNYAINVIEKFVDNYNYKIDILINNAGVMCSQLFPLISESEYDRVMNINLKTTFFLSQMISKKMIKNNISGNILMIASSSSNRPALNPYMLSKWAIRGLTSGLAKALIPYGIIVNGVAPGPTATAMLNKDGKNLDNPKNPSGRYCTVDEVSEMATYLLSKDGRMIVGELIYISGGAATITFDDQTYKLPEF